MSAKDLMALKRFAGVLLRYSADDIATAAAGGALIEVTDNGDENQAEG